VECPGPTALFLILKEAVERQAAWVERKSCAEQNVPYDNFIASLRHEARPGVFADSVFYQAAPLFNSQARCMPWPGRSGSSMTQAKTLSTFSMNNSPEDQANLVAAAEGKPLLPPTRHDPSATFYGPGCYMWTTMSKTWMTGRPAIECDCSMGGLVQHVGGPPGASTMKCRNPRWPNAPSSGQAYLNNLMNQATGIKLGTPTIFGCRAGTHAPPPPNFVLPPDLVRDFLNQVGR
jgi:hypothetical protein